LLGLGAKVSACVQTKIEASLEGCQAQASFTERLAFACLTHPANESQGIINEEDHVLFDPTAQPSALTDQSATGFVRRESRSNVMIRRKKLACLGLAAAASMALPSGLSSFSRLYADPSTGGSGSRDSQANPRDSQANPSSADLLKLGIDQYNQGQYEESVATLQEVNVKSLGEQDRQTWVSILSKANEAATQRRDARAELARGDEARKANRMADAQGHYNAVLSNPRADAGTRLAAQQELAHLVASQAKAPPDGKAVYRQAVDEYRKGLWQQARADFVKAQQLGFTGGFLEASPAEYLRKMDEGERKYVTKANTEGRDAYDRARQEYRDGDMVSAREDFTKARDLGFQPGDLEGLSPSDYLKRIDDADASQKEAQAGPVVAAGAPVQTVTLASDTVSTQSSGGPASEQSQLERQAEIDRLAEQQRVYKAQGLVDLGKKAESTGNDQEALNDYTQAVDLDPTNSQAVQGRDRLLAKMGRAPNQGGVTLTRTQQQISQAIQAINYKFSTAIDQARADTAANQFAQAENDIATAQAARDEDPTIFSAADLRRKDAAIQQATLELKQARAAYERRVAAEQAVSAARRQELVEEQDRHRREAAVAAYIKLSRAQIEQQNYAAALGVLDQILTIDPQNDYALGIRQFVEDKAILQEQRHYREEFDYNLERTLNQADEAQIPYGDIFRFPENWPDISTLRDAEAKNSNVSKEDQAVQAKLDQRLPSVQLPQVALSDAIDFLRDITGANILVNWKALEAAGIDKQSTQVSVLLRDVKFSKVLDIILQQAGAGKLAYTIDEGVITVSTADELNKVVVTRVYDITDLLINPNFDPTIQNISGGTSQVGGSGGGGGGTTTIGQNNNQSQNSTATRQQQLLDIKKKIENTVEFSSWKDNDPNGYGQIDDFNNQLIITQTAEVHDKIQNLLTQLREAQAVQVSIETRFLTVSRHFMESVGVNLSMTINARNNNLWSPITISNGTSAFTATPSTGLPGTITNAVGLGISGSYLDDFQVGLIINAVEASERISVVHEPRVTLQNGQGATIYQLTFIPYVASLNVSVATGASIAAPVIDDATDGVELIIERALVSADRKYVTLDVDPTLDSFLGFSTYTYEQAGVATAPSGTTSTTIISPYESTAGTLSVQEATEQKTEVRTRVTVPDGGTLMLGGVTIAGEINEEAGVPGLSKIPFLKRLTTNSSSANDEQVLLILLKPTILINKEIEAKNFPLLTSSTNK
jgi:general secretion pathway protein D